MAGIKLGTIQKYHLLRCMGIIKTIWEWNDKPLEQMKFHSPGIFGKTLNLDWVKADATKKCVSDVESLAEVIGSVYSRIERDLPDSDYLRVAMLMQLEKILVDECSYICPELRELKDYTDFEGTVDGILDWLGRKLTDVEELIAGNESVKLVDAFYTHIVSLDGETVRWFKGKWYSKEDSYYEAVHQVIVSGARNIGVRK